VPANRDFNPKAYFYGLIHWLKHFELHFIIPVLILFIFASFYFVKMERISFSIFTIGFSGASLQFLLLITFQIFFGYMYYKLGLLITFFFIGMILGAFVVNKHFTDYKSRYLSSLHIFLIAISISICFIPIIDSKILMNFTSENFLFPLLNIICGVSIGIGIPLTSKNSSEFKDAASSLFGADFLGSTIGAYLIATVLLPILGFIPVLLLIAAYNLIAAIYIYSEKLRPCSMHSLFVFPFVLSFGFLIYQESFSLIFTKFSQDYIFIYFIKVMIFVFLLLILLNLINSPIKRLWLSFISFFVFFLPGISPIFRCYFSIPYLYCHSCPSQCSFGLSRPFIVSGALLMNIEKKSWCNSFCPIGFLTNVPSIKNNFPRLISYFRYSLLLTIIVFLIYGYFDIKKSFNNFDNSTLNFFSKFFKGNYTFNYKIILIAFALYLFSFIIKKFWCRFLCPIGGTSDFVEKIIEKIIK
jgi:hypothetical protein